MRRKAAGHLRAVLENQGHKIGCRSAVGRVGQQLFRVVGHLPVSAAVQRVAMT
jgi:hypothetical protein